MAAFEPLRSDPIFVGGEPGIATLIVGLALDSHRGLTVGPNLSFLEPPNLGPYVVESCDVWQSAVRGDIDDGPADDPYLQAGLKFVRQCMRFGVRHGDLREVVCDLMDERSTDLSAFHDRCLLINAVGEYRRCETGAARWGIRIDGGIKVAGNLASIWPAGQFVNIVRDGRDVAAASVAARRASPRGWAGKAASAWLDAVPRPLLAQPYRYLEVRYEEVISDFERALKGMGDYLKMAWDDTFIFHAIVRYVAAAARGRADREIGRHRRELTVAEIGEFEQVAGAELRRLGYLANATA